MDMDMSNVHPAVAMATSIASPATSSLVAEATSAAVTASATAPAAMAMSMGGASGCKLSMLLNWHTIDACFLSSIFHIRSSFTFFLACLGALLLVISLEFLRRGQREFDRYLRTRSAVVTERAYARPAETEEKLLNHEAGEESSRPMQRPVVVMAEQLLRGLIHVLQFSVSYCIMLLFMYSNGFIIISILVGALVGFALFTRDTLYSALDTNKNGDTEKTCC